MFGRLLLFLYFNKLVQLLCLPIQVRTKTGDYAAGFGDMCLRRLDTLGCLSFFLAVGRQSTKYLPTTFALMVRIDPQ
ncbi:MAG: hypothetical protein M3178_04715 [Pseudomonadota bacterium]|nr:hypothetical protein [Pseudomonadota bacterium]